MEFFRIHKTIPFLKYRHILNGISLVSFLIAVYWIFTHGLAFSIEFTGGTQMEVNFPQTANTEQIRTDLKEISNEVLVQNFGTARDVVIRVPNKEGVTSGEVAANVMKVLEAKNPGVELRRTEFVGPQVGDELARDGGTALAQIAQHYLGSAGLFILAATVTLACLKTAVGLITSCAETFSALFPDGPKYRTWAIIFSLVSLLFANLGLSAIISYSLPVLMFLYPLSIALIALALLGKFFGHDRTVYCWTIGFTLIAAVYDLIIALPESVFNAIHGPAIKAFGQQYLPFADLGLGWICPTLIGTAIGLILHFMRGNRAKA
mgnify:CR=1 FL=1